MTRTQQIRARILKLWRWDSPSQGIEYTDDGEPDPEHVEAHARHANGVVDALAAIPPDDLAALLAVIEAAEAWEEAHTRVVDAPHGATILEWKTRRDDLYAAVRACREGGERG